ncbi:hypothetical protein LR48_Vigan02g203000 [Vigna angularis]|uniref:Uncharacterized protein n=1 Tax=Phaseolus angularis TaxID=3914 RepID=A0A0L9TZA8_PHAAN|nr:hypothetical protein LR48_Vigan02g203000 [Vigna angularis]
MAGLALVVALWNLGTTALALPPGETLGTTAQWNFGHYRPATVTRLIRYHSPWIIWKHPRLGPPATPHHMVQSSLHEKKDHWSFRMTPKLSYHVIILYNPKTPPCILSLRIMELRT